MEFEWDAGKARRNLAKHGVAFENTTEVFEDERSSTIEDPDASELEARYLIFGRDRAGKYLVVCFVERDNRIRLISARKMTPSERSAYEE